MTQRFFFIHVMKTGGSTFATHARANFAHEAAYPRRPHDPPDSYFDIGQLESLSPERRDEIRLYLGHFPYYVARDLAPDLTLLTVLRNPVDRTISLLSREQELRRPDESLAEIYEDEALNRRLIENHQTKVFAMDRADRPASFFQVLDLGLDRLARAKENLAAVDVVGLQERYPAFLDALSRRFGWQFGDVPRRKVGVRRSPPASLVRRIEADNALDLELYELARTELAV